MRIFATAFAASLGFSGIAAEKLKPRHDSAEQLFRRAPMAEASRSVVLNLATNFHAAFDTELCRIHTLWIGAPLNLWGPPYSYGKSPFICDVDGQVVYGLPQIQPWDSPARFKALETLGNFALEYQIGGCSVRERLSGVAQGEAWALRRVFEFAPAPTSEISLVLAAEPECEAVTIGHTVVLKGSGRGYSIKVEGSGGRLSPDRLPVDYATEVITEDGTEKGNPRIRHHGVETRVSLRVEPGTKKVAVVMGSGVEERIPAAPIGEAARVYDSGAARRESGDPAYRIEHFNLPSEAELMITGMDALPNGDLLLCSWLGEVYIVEGATGSVEEAKFKRIARGLNEPLGIAAAGTNLYVVQKGELTRLVDLNGDGTIDRFECVNASWGYSGNYHSYSFGPVATGDHELNVFITGQRGRADLRYQGWALQIDTRSGEETPICDGLRVPHGFGTYRGDLFVTDNQGNWIGACKLNHIRRGRFYGFPSSKPSPIGPRNAEDVTPPALWFPRSLSPSTSGFDTVHDSRFGPFEGQLIVGDFQNAILMRACLEKVNGEWQGAVFPFAKGFLSGVNRLRFNRDGKLYVGGGKRTWSTAAPSEWSLDRVSFTGHMPFEVKEVHAEPDGFSIVFTKSLDQQAAVDPENYLIKQFGYEYHAEYGSPEFDQEGKPGATELKIKSVVLKEDRRGVRLVIPSLRAGFVTAFQLALTSAEDEDLRTDLFYYTLNSIPKS